MTDLDALRAALEKADSSPNKLSARLHLHELLMQALRNGLLDDAALGRRILAGDEALVEAMARRIAREKGVEICSDASYRFSTFGPLARAALAALVRIAKGEIE